MFWLRSEARRAGHGGLILDKDFYISGTSSGRQEGEKRKWRCLRPNAPAPMIKMEEGGFREGDGEGIEMVGNPRHEEHRSKGGHDAWRTNHGAR